MFYSNNNNYMQDLYAYNQIPQGNTYTPYISNSMPNAGNENMRFSTSNNGMFIPNNMNTIHTMNPIMGSQNPNMFQGNQNSIMNNSINNSQNPNNLYPSIYRIINPVVNRVVSGSNIPYITEDTLNNLVDTVFNIVEGQIDLEDEIEISTSNDSINRGATTTTTSNTNTQNPSSNTNTRTTTTTNNRTPLNTTTSTNTTTNFSNTNRRHHNDNSLLRDLIKILILRQIFSRNCINQMPFNYPNNFQNQYTYNPNLMNY